MVFTLMIFVLNLGRILLVYVLIIIFVYYSVVTIAAHEPNVNVTLIVLNSIGII